MGVNDMWDKFHLSLVEAVRYTDDKQRNEVISRMCEICDYYSKSSMNMSWPSNRLIETLMHGLGLLKGDR
jgi:hypothetical protein